MSVREHLHEAIQSSPVIDDDLEGAMLMGWVVVAEWMAPNGHRWLTRIDGDANCEALPDWSVKGYLHDTLFSQEVVLVDGDTDDED